ncbi:MAG: molybdopterin-dependent oxidoreductase [Candidatus Xenobia bacterium]
MNRREFVKLGFMSAAMLGLAGCGLAPEAALVSQLQMPEIRTPGKSRYFATACGECAGGCGVSVRVVDGRAKKLEGNPKHPVSHGKLCTIGQSAVQALYNPDRLTSPQQGGNDAKWEDALKALAGQLDAAKAKAGSMLIVTRRLSGTPGALVLSLAQQVGAKVWLCHPTGSQAERTALKGLSGNSALPYYDLKNADFVLSFGGDFLSHGGSPVNYNWGYGEMRGRRDARGKLVTVSPRMNLSTAASDKWVPCQPGGEGYVALAIGNVIAKKKGGKWPAWAASVPMSKVQEMAGTLITAEVIDRIAAKLMAAKHPVVIGGYEPGAYTNGVWNLTVINALNELVSGGKPATMETDMLTLLPGQTAPAADMVLNTRAALDGLNAKTFTTVWVLDTNPVYLLPPAVKAADALKNASNVVLFSPYLNETASSAQWVLPIATWLESWGDATVRGPFAPNSATIDVYNTQQPAVGLRPGAMDLSDVLLAAAHRTTSIAAPYKDWAGMRELLRSRDAGDWDVVLARGGVWEEYSLDWEPYSSTAGPIWPPALVPKGGKAPAAVPAWEHVKGATVSGAEEPKFTDGEYVLLAYPSPVLGDGSVSNRPWLQELAPGVEMVVWADWIEVSMQLAHQLELDRGTHIRLTSAAGTIEGPAYPHPGLHPGAVAIPMGQGHTNFGRYASGRGIGALTAVAPQFQAETGELALFGTRVKVEKVGQLTPLISLDRRVGGIPRQVFMEPGRPNTDWHPDSSWR